MYLCCDTILYYLDMLFNLQTAYSSMRERERICKVYEQRPPSPIWLMSNPNWTLWMPTSILLTTFSKFANFYISKFRISFVWYHLTNSLHYLTCIPNFNVFSFLQWNLWRDMNSCTLVWTFQFDRHFCSKILANLTAN